MEENTNLQPNDDESGSEEPKQDWVEKTAVWFEVLAQWLEAVINYPIRLIRWIISCIRTFPRWPKIKSMAEIRQSMAEQSERDAADAAANTGAGQ